MERTEIARMIDHTLLAPTATDDEVAALCAEAAELGVGAVCVSPGRLPLPPGALPAGIQVCTVVGFPSGAHRSPIKAAEAARAVVDGATEIDMVIDLGVATDGRWDDVEADIASVRSAVLGHLVLKVIIEAAALSPGAIVAVCEAAERAGADFVKTSTGFHPSGGASVSAVELMAGTVGGRLGVKASGGIRDAATARAMIEAGATRLGCSATRTILDGFGS